MKLHIPLLLLSISLVSSSPIPGKVKYDQRQDGELNVRADLENFVILVIPTSSAGGSMPALGLLDLLSKAIPIRSHNKRNKHVKPQRQETPTEDIEDETQTFIESKTAPYHVDITKSRKNLAKLHPQLAVSDETQEELLVSPNLALIKTADDLEDRGRSQGSRGLRMAKGFVLSMPLEVEEDVVRIDQKRKESKDTKKKLEFVKGALGAAGGKTGEGKMKLLLFGAENGEECGPGYERDDDGVCQFVERV